jgi:phage terminase large subunit
LITPLETNKDVRVHTAWDLGVSDSTAIWFIQCIGRERRIVDYYEASGVGLDHYTQVLYDKRKENGWKYGEHFFPHDVKVREFTSGKSRVQSLSACQSAFDRDPRSASKRDPLGLRFGRLAFAPSELVGVAETGRARVDV